MMMTMIVVHFQHRRDDDDYDERQAIPFRQFWKEALCCEIVVAVTVVIVIGFDG